MKIYYISQVTRKSFTAGAKPTLDFEEMLKRYGAKEIGISKYLKLFSFLNRGIRFLNFISYKIATARMPRNQIVILQYPSQLFISEIAKKAIKNNNKLIFLIHDLDSLRIAGREEMDILKDADVLIAHTQKMKEYLQNYYGIRNVIILELFDYLLSTIPENKITFNGNYDLVFAGNLEKSKFIYDLNFQDSAKFSIDLYGTGYTENKNQKALYKGAVDPNKLPEIISKYHFGIVWDGPEVSKCGGLYGNYLQYNIPYKVSTYLASGLPVIIWSKMGISNFILKNNLGIAVDSLEDLGKVLPNLSFEKYLEMRKSVEKIQYKITKGSFSTAAITAACNACDSL